MRNVLQLADLSHTVMGDILKLGYVPNLGGALLESFNMTSIAKRILNDPKAMDQLKTWTADMSNKQVGLRYQFSIPKSSSFI